MNIYEFTEYLHNTVKNATEDELEKLYDEYICIEFKHHQVKIPFDAVSHNALIDFLENLTENY